MEEHQALMVAHRDGHPHMHVIANRVDLESGKAAGAGRSRLRLSEWAEGYEDARGQIRCERRERNNYFRKQGNRMPDRVSLPTERYRRERMNPHQTPREAVPARRQSQEQVVVT